MRISFSRTAATLVAAAGVAMSAAPAARASMSIPMSPEALRDQSPVIVVADVEDVRSGLDPARDRLATYVTLRVVEGLRGAEPGDELVVREPGGLWGERALVLDAVPRYAAGERVLAFLQSARDGALRTSGMFQGKFRIRPGSAHAERDLDGAGWIPGAAAPAASFDLDALRAVARDPQAPAPDGLPGAAASGPRLHREFDRRRDAAERGWLPRPAEWPRLAWDAGVASDPAPGARFAPLSTANPTRWRSTDWGGTIPFRLERARAPLADPLAAVAAIEQALAAWRDAPESRVHPTLSDDDYDYTGIHGQSPAAAYVSVNAILFGDPYDDIAPPSGCSGTLAIGGYWRTGAIGSTVNGVAFHDALQGYVIFNDGFECFLGNPQNLAEVAAHEVGHALGFGHSTEPDAIMRSTAYGGRGARLGDDDVDAAHCHYPHALDVTDPDAGALWYAGMRRSIRWSATYEAGPDAGTVELDVSLDGGATWSAVAPGAANDGAFDWTPPGGAEGDLRVRVRRSRRVEGGSYPVACSGDASAGANQLVAPASLAGGIRGDGPGAGLRVGRTPGGDVALEWDVSCTGLEDGYAVYAGDLGLLRQGFWSHVPATCDTGGARSMTVSAAGASRYYLVAPLAASREGSLGAGSDGAPRPASGQACLPRESAPGCEP